MRANTGRFRSSTAPTVADLVVGGGHRDRVAPRASRAHNGVVADQAFRDEVEAAVAARRELGDELEPAVIDGFVERIEQRLAARDEQSERALMRRRNHQKEMTLGSMAISIPLLAIAAVFTGLPGVVAVCAALVVIAIVSARQP
jgi:hypothetical protein